MSILGRFNTPFPRAPFAHVLVATLASVLLAACGKPSPVDPPIVTTPGSFSIAVAPAAVSVVQGANQTATITIARQDGFTGVVALAVTGAPTGVTVTLSSTQIVTGQTTSTMTVSASGAAAAGTVTLTINATGTDVTARSATLGLTVTAAPQTGPFALALSVSSYLVLPPPAGVAFPVLTITRDPGFTGTVSFSVSGLPSSLVLGLSPSNVTGSTTNLVIINAGAPNGVYTATIRGVAAGLGERTITLPITVASPTAGSVTWTFCESAPRYPQMFFAVKDGSGPWARIVPNGNTYSFNVAQATASVAMVTAQGGGYHTTVYQYTAAEIAAAGASDCTLYPSSSSRTVNGTVTGLANGELSLLGMGWWFASTTNPLGGTVSNYSLLNLPAGPLDFMASRSHVVTGTNRLILRRGLNPASGASLAPVDFNAAESFAPTASTWTFGNLNGESFTMNQIYLTAGGTVGLFQTILSADRPGVDRAVFGVPPAQSVAGDLHQVVATIGELATNEATRQVVAYESSLSDRTLDFGPVMPAANVSLVTGSPAGRVRAQGSVPAEYDDGIAFDIEQKGVDRYVSVYATRGFLGAGLDYDVQIPDLSAVLGWDTNFNLRTGTSANWWVSGGGPILELFDPRFIFNSTRARWAGAMTGITAPADGQVWRMGRTNGTITP